MTFAVFTVVLAIGLALYSAPASAQADAATLTAQFDNRAYRLTGGKKQAIMDAIAQAFGLTSKQVQFISAIDQSGVTAQSVGTYKITGPSSQKKKVLQVCDEVIRSLPGFDSKLENTIEKATDTWLPGDKVEFQKGTCAQA